jgi:hypothetical protein
MLQQLVEMECIYTTLQNVALSATRILSLHKGFPFTEFVPKIHIKDGSKVLKSTSKLINALHNISSVLEVLMTPGRCPTLSQKSLWDH